MSKTRGVWAGAFFALCACGADEPEKAPEDQAIEEVKEYLTDEIGALHAAASELQEAAPAPDADGWNATDDAEAVNKMKAAWAKLRASYEHIEGAIAPFFMPLDEAIDARYDFFIADGPDTNPFDGIGVTGVHAIERILWADQIPATVVEFESQLPNYAAPAFPKDMREASEFKTGLSQQLIDDIGELHQMFEPLAFDLPTAYDGVVGSMREQFEKVKLAQTGEDESRYAAHTLADMRANLAGGKAIFGAFSAMFEAQGEAGKALRDQIDASFARVEAHYDSIQGDAIPEVPATWNPDAPSADDKKTAYGKLFELLSQETNQNSMGSLVSLMNAGAKMTGIQP
jgi:iron uptake system component EfeO